MLRRTILAFALLLAACTAQQGGSGQQGNNGRPPQGQQPSIDGQPQQASGGQQAGNGQSSGNRPVATHPRCGAVSSFALPTGTRQVVLSTFQATQFELSCFGFLFRPSQSCSSTIQGAKMGRIVLNATSTDGASSVTSVDMSRLYSGSVSGTMLAFDAPMTFVMYAELLPSFVATCDINVFVSSFYAIAKPAVPTAVPVLQMAEPSIIGVGQTATLSFQLTNATAATVRFVTIPDSTAQACSTAAAAYGTAATPSVVLTAADRFNWTFSALTTSGRYRVCAWTSAAQQWTVAAVLFVYGGNPAFFIASPQSSGNQQGMAQPFELRFVGTNLSAASDSIRFISNVNGGQCSASTVSDTSITVKSISTTPMGDVAAQVSVVGGNNLFRVCYYTAATSTWTEVPDFDTLPRDLLRNGTNTSNTRLPSNTSSTTTATTTTTSCPTAPVNANFTAVTTNNVAVLTVKGSTLPSSMDANIAALLCLPETSDVTILRFEPGTTTSNVYVQVSCPTSSATTTTTKCNAAERLAALVQNAGSLTGVQAATTVSFNGLAAASNDSDHGDAGNPIVIGLAAGLASAVLVIAALVAAVLVYRHRRNARIASMTTNVIRVAYPDEEDLEIVQGDVIGFDGQREDEDNAPIPPPQEKPTKTVPMYEPSTPTHPSEVRE